MRHRRLARRGLRSLFRAAAADLQSRVLERELRVVGQVQSVHVEDLRLLLETWLGRLLERLVRGTRGVHQLGLLLGEVFESGEHEVLLSVGQANRARLRVGHEGVVGGRLLGRDLAQRRRLGRQVPHGRLGRCVVAGGALDGAFPGPDDDRACSPRHTFARGFLVAQCGQASLRVFLGRRGRPESQSFPLNFLVPALLVVLDVEAGHGKLLRSQAVFLVLLQRL